jgi:citrate lyase alpha subunit
MPTSARCVTIGATVGAVVGATVVVVVDTRRGTVVVVVVVDVVDVVVDVDEVDDVDVVDVGAGAARSTAAPAHVLIPSSAASATVRRTVVRSGAPAPSGRHRQPPATPRRG